MISIRYDDELTLEEYTIIEYEMAIHKYLSPTHIEIRLFFFWFLIPKKNFLKWVVDEQWCNHEQCIPIIYLNFFLQNYQKKKFFFFFFLFSIFRIFFFEFLSPNLRIFWLENAAIKLYKLYQFSTYCSNQQHKQRSRIQVFHKHVFRSSNVRSEMCVCSIIEKKP